MDVIGSGEQAWAEGSYRLRIFGLIAGVAESGQTEGVLDPLAEVPGSVRFSDGLRGHAGHRCDRPERFDEGSSI
jgi:hypothetical protein